MPRRKTVELGGVEAALASAQASLRGAQASFHLLVRSIVDQLPDPRRARAVGLLLDEVARGKLYRLVGHASLDAFLRDALGISRATAYRLRRIARAPASDTVAKHGKMRAYEAVRDAEARAANAKANAKPGRRGNP